MNANLFDVFLDKSGIELEKYGVEHIGEFGADKIVKLILNNKNRLDDHHLQTLLFMLRNPPYEPVLLEFLDKLQFDKHYQMSAIMARGILFLNAEQKT